MAGLVADYCSESDGEESDSSQSSNKISGEAPLPKPNFKTGADESTKCSVFVNPFIEADNAKTAILEKHVKMISADVKALNNKKICWNYRKNKCTFGHNCKYVHDSDLQRDRSNIVQYKSNVKQIDIKKIVGCVDSIEPLLKKKKRPGMIQEIVPSKKVMKKYNNQKNKKLENKGFEQVKLKS